MKIPNYNNKEIKVMMEYNYIPNQIFQSKNTEKQQKMQKIIHCQNKSFYILFTK